ncbi:helix-turn-helix domain-containing protein [Sphingobacterium bambusae]
MMSEQQQVFNIWEKSSFSKPLHRDTFKGMHLAALQHLAEKSSDKELYVIRYADHDFVLLEVKGTLSKDMHIDLGATGVGGMWLCLQFQGQTIFSAYERLAPERMAAVKTRVEGTDPCLSSEKNWGLFLGLSAALQQQLTMEFPILNDYLTKQLEGIPLPEVPISYADRRLLDTFSKMKFGSFSTKHHLGQLYLKLYANYAQRLPYAERRSTDESNIQLYHRAKQYIQENCMEKLLDRETLADALHCSVRTINRAFEGRKLSLAAQVLDARLRKARELLKHRTDLPIEQIALMLYFYDGSHLNIHYKKRFHRTPRQERKEVKAKRR